MKKLPFKSAFIKGPDGRVGFTITDPLQVFEAFDYAETKPEIHTIVIDTLTFLMDMFETQYVIGSKNTMEGWSQYAQFFKKLMSHYAAKSTKNVIILAHVSDVLNESEMTLDTLVKVKGSVMNQGVEAMFSHVISTKKIPVKKLKEYPNDLLTITEEEELLTYKHVFQTRITKDTINERIRSSDSMWSIKETYINNDCQLVLDRLHEYYN